MALFGLVAAWNLPAIGFVARPSPVPDGFRFLDPSWVIGVNWALTRGLAWGREIVFPYGPLGFLHENYLVDVELFRLSVVFELALYALLVAALYGFTKAVELDLRWTAAFVGVLVLLPLPALDFHGPIVLALLVFLTLRRVRGGSGAVSRPAVAGITFLAALLSLIKLTLLVAAVGLICLFGLALAVPRLESLRARGALRASTLRKAASATITPVLAYAGWFLLLWMAAGQPLAALDDFLLTGYDLVSGYSSAMGLVHFHRFTALGLGSATLLPVLGATFLVALVILLAEAARRMAATDVDVPVLFLLIALLGVALIAFKHGFVRFDGHVFGFLSTAPLVALLAVSLSRTRLSKPAGGGVPSPSSDLAVAGLAILAATAAFASFPLAPLRPGIVEHAGGYRQAALFFVDGERARAYVEEQKARILDAYALPDPAGVRETIGDRSVDAVPWDVALLWAMDLEWVPRPAFHSYATYTARLDEMNARALRDAPPEYVVYRHLAIDGQHPMYANPLTLRTLAGGYDHVSDPGGGYMLLRRSDDPQEIRLEPLARTTAAFGERIPVPDPGAPVYATIHVRYSLRGRVLKTLYKPARIYIQLHSEDTGASRRYRFVADPARNGVLVSENVDRPDAFRALVAGGAPGGVAAMELTTEDRGHYRPEIEIEFAAARTDAGHPTTNGPSSR